MRDDHHVSILTSSASCGIAEASNLGKDMSKVLYAIASYFYHPARGSPSAFLMWSDVKGGRGKDLMDFILKHLQTYDDDLYDSKLVENPKTSNEIQVYLWLIPHKEFKEWYLRERVRRASKL